MIEYGDIEGFYYDSKLGERKKLNVFLSSKDIKWNTTISNYRELTCEETLAATNPAWRHCDDGKYRKLHVETDGTKWYEVKNTKDASIISIENQDGNLLIGKEKSACFVSYYASNYIRGVYIITYHHEKIILKVNIKDIFQKLIRKKGIL